MKIEICGPGCARCIAAEEDAGKALEELEKEAKSGENEEGDSGRRQNS